MRFLATLAFAFALACGLALPAFIPVTDCTGQTDGTACDDSNACTLNDVCESGVCLGTPTPALDEVTGLAVTKGVVSWNPVAHATRYDVARGRVNALPVSPTGILQTGLGPFSGTSFTDSVNPTPGGTVWYLVRAANNCVSGPWGFELQDGIAIPVTTNGGCVSNPNASPPYVDNGLTVTDLTTCLEWEKKIVSYGDRHDVDFHYDWTYVNGPWIEGVNQEHFARHHDWRVATSSGCCGRETGLPPELESILAVGRTPAIDPIFGPTGDGWYWSSSTFGDLENYAWEVDFSDGTKNGHLRRNLYRVRAVRGGP